MSQVRFLKIWSRKKGLNFGFRKFGLGKKVSVRALENHVLEKKSVSFGLVTQWDVGIGQVWAMGNAYNVKWNRKCANMQCAPPLLRGKLEKKAFKYATWQLKGLAPASNEASCRQKAAHLTITTCIIVLGKSSALGK